MEASHGASAAAGALVLSLLAAYVVHRSIANQKQREPESLPQDNQPENMPLDAPCSTELDSQQEKKPAEAMREALDRLKQCNEMQAKAMRVLSKFQTPTQAADNSRWSRLRRQRDSAVQLSQGATTDQTSAVELSQGATTDQIAVLRMVREYTDECSSAAFQALEALLPMQTPSSRAGYLQTITDLIGRKPSRRWQDEWAALAAERDRPSRANSPPPRLAGLARVPRLRQARRP